MTIYKFSNKQLLTGGLILLTMVAIVAGALFYVKKNPSVLGIKLEPSASAEPAAELAAIIKNIGKVMLLPGSETPTLATVSEVEKLRSQSFFKNAVNGDKVLIYAQAKKAILWRPSNNIIIEVGSVSQTEEAQKTITSQNEETDTRPETKLDLEKKVLFLNGSGQSGVTNVVSEKAKSIPGLVVIDRVVANRSDYSESIVVDLTESRQLEAQLIAQELGAVTSTLPEGEVTPEGVDFIVIVGRDMVSL